MKKIDLAAAQEAFNELATAINRVTESFRQVAVKASEMDGRLDAIEEQLQCGSCNKPADKGGGVAKIHTHIDGISQGTLPPNFVEKSNGR
ncbi:hypothetical protein DSCW_07640 [Desulfosarcina widdelii]|uniref:Uncharacterized protein n=1 Tax=Desulfosarcina widdelii TaxID=947919 RepID=A0A5K7ZA48_9BACT|nr:hypothetical protein [Desulfosarcina widdelii]BBO73347.1 hypothetical protein DSCW_07640 [Desulfosarcina widdelii]